MNNKSTYSIIEQDANGKTLCVISGMGRNKGTWDATANSISTARRWLREVRREHPARRFAISEN